MSRVLQPTNPTQFPVLPGAQVVTQIPMATAVNAGDYVYLTSSGYGVASATGSIGNYTVPISGFLASGSLQSGALAGYQYGPVQQQGTYTGTTYTAGQVVNGPTTLNSVSNSNQMACCTALSGGNFVFVYRTSASNYSFQIISASGTVVAGPTAIASNFSDTNTRRICVSSTQNGGFLVGYMPNSGTNLVVRLYDSSGGLISANNIALTGGLSSSSTYFLNVMQLANGSFAYAFALSNSAYYGIVDSAFAVVLATTAIDTTYANNMANSQYLVGCSLLYGGFVLAWYDATYSSRLQVFTNTGQKYYPTTAGNSASSGSAYRTFSICPTQDGNFAMTWNSGSAQVAARYQITPTTVNSVGSVTVASVVQSTYPTCICSCQNDGLGVFYYDASLFPYVNFSTSSNFGSTTFGTPVLINGSVTNTIYADTNGSFCAPTGKACFVVNNVSNFVSSIIVSSVAVTNGQTYTGRPFTPPQYIFQGVSVNAASANQTATVVINGAATLNSNYPSLTTVAPFDFSGAGQFGNAGFVFGRVVAMRGAE